jgi:hypothetical protein
MAVGDIINATFSSGTQNFQPASGVEIMVTYVAGNAGGGYSSFSSSNVGLTDGTNVARFEVARATCRITTHFFSSTDSSNGNLKIGITNAVYLSMGVSGNAGYSGIQTK